MAKATEEKDGFSPDSPESQQAKLTNQYLELVTDPTLQDPRMVQRQIANRILSAESVDDILAMGETSALSAEDIVDKAFTILETSWHQSAPQYRENSSGVFVVLTCKMDEDGRTEVITSGAENVLAQLYRATKLGGFGDRKMRFRGVLTAQGYTTYWLASA